MSEQMPDTTGEHASGAVTIISGRQAWRDAAVELVGHAQLQLRVLSQELDRRIWSDPDLVEQLQTFALRSQRSELRILVNRPALAAQHGHRLVELARRLPSRIAIRELNEEHRGLTEEFSVADEQALLYKGRHDDLDAQWSAHAPLDARRLRRRFDQLWDESPPARELAILGL
ncbi:hypothetical protein [Solimonas terrae]|uniref:DUF7931 domain-containing protein n=1 Tax=Solimonas terrae TaxID=1396819 RepID=A0A6M2BWI2_9GAMM|nr:hypothetical protein [Solimonas terrae]NGY06339.1 hypothetical protein [Solimonas terrae]